MIGAIVTVGWIGHLRPAPGTWGSLPAIPLVWGLHWLGGFWLVLPATLVVTALGWWAVAQYLEGRGDDPSEVVIDELAGMMIALWPLSLGLTVIEAAPHIFPWPGWVLGFVLFRALDVFKPGPVGWAEKAPGATGVMLDDLVAGVIAALVAALAAGVSHGWFG